MSAFLQKGRRKAVLYDPFTGFSLATCRSKEIWNQSFQWNQLVSLVFPHFTSSHTYPFLVESLPILLCKYEWTLFCYNSRDKKNIHLVKKVIRWRGQQEISSNSESPKGSCSAHTVYTAPHDLANSEKKSKEKGQCVYSITTIFLGGFDTLLSCSLSRNWLIFQRGFQKRTLDAIFCWQFSESL